MPKPVMRAEAEHLASKFPPLRLAARRLAATVRQGAHGRRRSGAGEAFWQFRPYQSFDTALAVDWRQSAKRGQVYVRQREWQTAQTVWLWRNGSASMAYASAPALPTKQARADLLVLALASLLAAGDEAVGLLGARARAGAGAVDAVAEGLDHPSGAATPPRSAVARGGQVVLVSDFLAAPQQTAADVAALAAAGAEGHLVHIIDPAEADFPFAGRVRFEGMADESAHVVDQADAIADAYRQRWRARRAALGDIARRHGWGVLHHLTDSPPETALLNLYTHLTETVR